MQSAIRKTAEWESVVDNNANNLGCCVNFVLKQIVFHFNYPCEMWAKKKVFNSIFLLKLQVNRNCGNKKEEKFLLLKQHCLELWSWPSMRCKLLCTFVNLGVMSFIWLGYYTERNKSSWVTITTAASTFGDLFSSSFWNVHNFAPAISVSLGASQQP